MSEYKNGLAQGRKIREGSPGMNWLWTRDRLLETWLPAIFRYSEIECSAIESFSVDLPGSGEELFSCQAADPASAITDDVYTAVSCQR